MKEIYGAERHILKTHSQLSHLSLPLYLPVIFKINLGVMCVVPYKALFWSHKAPGISALFSVYHLIMFNQIF